MSNALTGRSFSGFIAASILTAWAPVKIYLGPPREVIGVALLPCAWIDFDPVRIDLVNSQNMPQHYTFQVHGRWQDPSNPALPSLLQSEDRANELIAQLQTSPNFGADGYMPYVSGVSYELSASAGEGSYEVHLTFQVSRIATHH